MPRLIDADALLEELPVHPDGGMRSVKDECLMIRVRQTVRNAPTIGGWISVKDKMPDTDGEYLVYGQSEAMRELLPDNDPIWICYYCKEHGFYNIELHREYDYITHWMLLPKPPKEVTGDD